MPSTVVKAEKEMLVMPDALNVAVSATPLGGPPADQLAALFQSPDTGLVFQVALPARLGWLLSIKIKTGKVRARKKCGRTPRVAFCVFIGSLVLVG